MVTKQCYKNSRPTGRTGRLAVSDECSLEGLARMGRSPARANARARACGCRSSVCTRSVGRSVCAGQWRRSTGRRRRRRRRQTRSPPPPPPTVLSINNDSTSAASEPVGAAARRGAAAYNLESYAPNTRVIPSSHRPTPDATRRSSCGARRRRRAV